MPRAASRFRILGSTTHYGKSDVSESHGHSRRGAVYSDDVPDQVEDAADQLEPHAAVAVEDAGDQVEPHAAAAIVDVFVYVVVLNLFIEYLPRCSVRPSPSPCLRPSC